MADESPIQNPAGGAIHPAIGDFSTEWLGQIQHTVGVMNAKVIVAINNDKNAPIFKVADYGIVGDLYQVVPKLTERLQSEFGR